MMKFDSEDYMTSEDFLSQNSAKEAETGAESLKSVSKKEVNLNWKWSKGMKPSGRPIGEILSDARQEFLEKEGRLYTEEECAAIVDEIRKELREKGET